MCEKSKMDQKSWKIQVCMVIFKEEGFDDWEVGIATIRTPNPVSTEDQSQGIKINDLYGEPIAMAYCKYRLRPDLGQFEVDQIAQYHREPNHD